MLNTSTENVLTQVRKITESLRAHKPYVGPFGFFSVGISLIFEFGAGVAARFDTCARGSASFAATPVPEEAEVTFLTAMAVLLGAELDDANSTILVSLDEAAPEATATDATAPEATATATHAG